MESLFNCCERAEYFCRNLVKILGVEFAKLRKYMRFSFGCRGSIHMFMSSSAFTQVHVSGSFESCDVDEINS